MEKSYRIMFKDEKMGITRAMGLGPGHMLNRNKAHMSRFDKSTARRVVHELRDLYPNATITVKRF